MKRQKRKPWKVEKTGNVTVSIYRRVKAHKPTRAKYVSFEVSDYTAGYRRLRSFADSTEAIEEAKRIGRLLSTGEATAATMRNSEAASYGRAVELLRPLGTPLELAAAHYAEAFKILGRDRIVEAASDFIRRNPTERPPRTVKQVADELVELKRNRQASARYLEDLRTRLDTFAQRFAVNVDTITTADVQRWLDGMDAAPRTVRNFRNAANGLFKFAEARGYIAKGENPVTATEKITARNSEPISIYTPAELARLLDAAPEWFKPVIALQAFAGLRSAEVMRLDWRDVKLDRGHVEICAGKSKTATRRLVPITENLAAWLAPHARKSGKVFRHSRAYFHEVQRDVAAATEAKADAKNGIGAQKPVTWKHNALRHSFVSYRVADIADVPRVALESGNSPAMIFAHYRELVTPADAKTWFAVAPEAPANVVQMSKAEK
jgi:integrase